MKSVSLQGSSRPRPWDGRPGVPGRRPFRCRSRAARGHPPELAELLGVAGAAKDPAARERADARREELTAGPVELIRLTELGTRAVRQRLLETGRDALLVGELAQASAAGLLGVLTEDYDPDAARTELAGWITARGGREGALRQLTDAVRTMTFRTRAQAMLDVLAALFVGALQERGFRGDEELADRLGAATGYAAISLLRPLAVDLEMLAMLLEGDPAESGGRIDLSTGECQPAFTDELGPGPEAGEDDDPERWLYVPALGSRAGYRDMQLFIEDVGDAALADRLRIAIGERGAFRRFKDVLAGHERSWSRYHRFRDERQRGRTRAWLAEEGYYPHVTFLVEPSSGSCTSGPV